MVSHAATGCFEVPSRGPTPEQTLFVAGLNEGKFFGQAVRAGFGPGAGGSQTMDDIGRWFMMLCLYQKGAL